MRQGQPHLEDGSVYRQVWWAGLDKIENRGRFAGRIVRRHGDCVCQRGLGSNHLDALHEVADTDTFRQRLGEGLEASGLGAPVPTPDAECSRAGYQAEGLYHPIYSLGWYVRADAAESEGLPDAALPALKPLEVKPIVQIAEFCLGGCRIRL